MAAFAGFAAGGAPELQLNASEIDPKVYFADFKEVETWAKLVLTVSDANNSRKLSSLWTLIHGDTLYGREGNTPAQSGAVARSVFDFWISLGFVDTDGVFSNAIQQLEERIEQGTLAFSARDNVLRFLLKFLIAQIFPHQAVVVMGFTRAAQAQPGDGSVIIVRHPSSAGNRRLADIRPIGKGSFGKVHSANFTGPDDHVPGVACPGPEAVKDIDIYEMGCRTGPTVIPELESRLKREIANQLLVRHRGIVTLFDFSSVQPLYGRPPPGTEGELIRYSGARLLLNMELCPGRELYDEIVDKTFASPEGAECLLVALSVTGRALLYLHFASIVHRDIKPENIGYFFDPSRSGDIRDKIVCKLFDFGLSKRITSQMGGVTGKIGTPDYRAPEVGVAPFLHDYKADVYSFGITLAAGFGMGWPHFDPVTHEISCLQGPGGVLAWTNLSPKLKDLIRGCTRRNPATRLSMEQVMQHDFWGDERVGAEELEGLRLEGVATRQSMDLAGEVPDLF